MPYRCNLSIITKSSLFCTLFGLPKKTEEPAQRLRNKAIWHCSYGLRALQLTLTMLLAIYSYDYDASGNRTSYTQHDHLTYDAANEFHSVPLATCPQESPTPMITMATCSGLEPVSPSITYNAANEMTAFGSTTFSYSGPDQNQRVQVNSTNYVYSGLGCDCESNSAGSTYYTHDNKGQLIDERTSTGTYYYLFDGLGSVVGLTDSTGALVGNETYQYDPYGQLIRQPRSAALRTNTWRYASGYYDVSTGLYKFGIRYYDATTGRWTQRDPVGGSLQETTKVKPVCVYR